jgi:hypothetical protein
VDALFEAWRSTKRQASTSRRSGRAIIQRLAVPLGRIIVDPSRRALAAIKFECIAGFTTVRAVRSLDL